MATAAHRSQSTAPESEALHQVIPSLSLIRRGLVNSNPSRTLAPSIARLTEKVKQRIERSHRLRDAARRRAARRVRARTAGGHGLESRILSPFPPACHRLLERHVTDDMSGRHPGGSASMPQSTSRPTTLLGWNVSCATVPVLPSPSSGSKPPTTVRPEASASSIVFPIPHRAAAMRLGCIRPQGSSDTLSDKPHGF